MNLLIHSLSPGNSEDHRMSKEKTKNSHCFSWSLKGEEASLHKFPEDAHDPAHHDDGCEDLDEGCGDVQPEDTAHVPVREVRAGATQHGEGRDERPCERPEGTAFGGRWETQRRVCPS